MVTRRESVRLLGAAGLVHALGACSPASNKTDHPVTFASPAPVWWNAVPLIAEKHALYEGEHVKVDSFNVATGVKAKEAIVAGNAQIGVASPNAFSITTDRDLAKLRILGSITQSSSTVAIISRRPISEITRTRIGYVKGAISEFYLIAHLINTGQIDDYVSKKITLVALPPPGLLTAFEHGDIDSVSAWEPFASQIEALAKRRGEKVDVLRDPSLYIQHIFAVASEDALKTSRASVDRVVTALRKACEYIEANRPTVGNELERFFQFPAGFLTGGSVWPTVSFKYNRDREVILAALRRDLELAQHARTAQAGQAALDGVLRELI